MRVSREDFTGVKRQHQKSAQMAAKRAADAAKAAAGASSNGTNGETSANGEDVKADKDVKDESGAGGSGTPNSGNMPPPQGPGLQVPPGQQPNQTNQPRQPWELVDEVMNMLKTAFPLLALTMEKMVDQISLRAKPSSDEDIYRFFAALLADALQVRALAGTKTGRADEQQWGGRSGVPNDDGELNAMTKENLNKFSNNLSGDLKVGSHFACGRSMLMISLPSRRTS